MSILRTSLIDHLLSQMREDIRAGRLAGRLPGVCSLAGEYGVSHGTLRAGLIQLEREGMIKPGGNGRSRMVVTPKSMVSKKWGQGSNFDKFSSVSEFEAEMRIWSGYNVIFESSFCYHCSNFYITYPGGGSGYINSSLKEFQKVMEQLMPIPQAEKDRLKKSQEDANK